MRLDAIRISNFRGIKLAELGELAGSPLITVSGPNGAGKSIFFEAIALMWRIISVWERRQIIPSNIIGPWANETRIDVAVVLAGRERDFLADYAERTGSPTPEDDRAELSLRIQHTDDPLTLSAAPWAGPLWTLDFTTTHSFVNVDFFPADRAFPRGEQAAVNPALLSEQQRESFAIRSSDHSPNSASS